MEKVTIDVQKREGSAKDLRKNDQLPLAYYGNGVENLDLSADYQTFRRAYRATGRSAILTCNLDGKELDTLVHDVQYHPVTDMMIHVDLMAVKKGQKMHTEVPFSFVGESPAVKQMSGTLIKKDHVMVECLPKDLPHDIEVDISILVDFHTTITVADLKLPEGVKVLDDPEVMVANVAAPQKEEEEVKPAEGEAAEGEEKKEGEAAEGEEKKEGESSEEKKD